MVSNWDDVLVFQAVAEELSFTRGAQRLHLSVPTVSQRVRRLERHVGRQLIFRTTVRVALTPDGEELLAWVTRTLASWQELQERWQLRDDPSPAGLPERVVLGLSQVNHAQLLEQLEQAYDATRWVVRIMASTREGLQQVRAGELDALLWQNWPFSDPEDTTGMRTATIWRSPIWVYLAHGHVRGADAAVDLSALEREPFIGSSDPEIRTIMSRFYRSVGGFTPRFTHIIDDPREIHELIKGGNGVTVGSAGARTGPGIVRRPIIGAPPAPMLLTWDPVRTPAALVEAVVTTTRRTCAANLATVNPELYAAILADPDRAPELANL